MIENYPLIHNVPLIGKAVIILDKQQYLVLWAMQWAGLLSSGGNQSRALWVHLIQGARYDAGLPLR